ncbi:MAG: glutaredoxin 3 [Gammaproteobacteria bacterium]|nr:glutaredoxin 3 [Gammaproteobacteria bacterium]
MTNVVIYSSGMCSYCARARQLLERKGVRYTEHRVDEQADLRHEMELKSRRRSVPQIFINDAHIGGFEELAQLERNGRLEALLLQPCLARQMGAG